MQCYKLFWINASIVHTYLQDTTSRQLFSVSVSTYVCIAPEAYPNPDNRAPFHDSAPIHFHLILRYESQISQYFWNS